jgi:hypothetical protein
VRLLLRRLFSLQRQRRKENEMALGKTMSRMGPKFKAAMENPRTSSAAPEGRGIKAMMAKAAAAAKARGTEEEEEEAAARGMPKRLRGLRGAIARAKPPGMKKGGMADKSGRAMKSKTADAKGRAMKKGK